MAVIQKDYNSMGLPMNISRSNPIPLDSSAIYYSYADALSYAQSSAIAYVGQVIAVVDETNNTANVYVIKDTAGNLTELTGSGGGELPIFITDPTAGDILRYDATLGKWVNKPGGDLDNTIDFIKNSLIEDFSTTATYPVNAVVRYNNECWRCSTAVTEAGEWTAANWTKKVLSEYYIKSGTTAYWTASDYTPVFGEMIIYTDAMNFKIGDGIHLAKNLDFYCPTSEDRERWDNKMRCYIDDDNTSLLVFTTD